MVLIAAVIVSATLVPSRTGPTRPFSFCMTCDFRWLADAVLNVALFLPLGIAAGWRARAVWRPVVAGAAMSTAIELLQLVVPGRDPSLRDIITNTAGVALGVAMVYRPMAWLIPRASRAWRYQTAAALTILVVTACTAFLLAPAPGAANGVSPLYDTSGHDVLRVSRRGADAVALYESRADLIRLDQPSYVVRGLFGDVSPDEAVRVDVSRKWSGWCLGVRDVQRCRIGPTLGRGWAVLVYPSAFGHRWADALFDAVWTAILFFPLGFWATRQTAIPTFGSAILLLAVAPIAMRLTPTTIGEWLAGLLSIGVAYLVAQSLHRRFGVIVRTVPGAR